MSTLQLGDRIVYIGLSSWIPQYSLGTIVAWRDELGVRFHEYNYISDCDCHDIIRHELELEHVFNSPLNKALR